MRARSASPALSRLARATAPACAFAMLLGTCSLPSPPPASTARAAAVAPAPIDEDVAAFYRAREFRPVWVSGRTLRPEARILLRMTVNRPALAAAVDAARAGDPRSLTRADLMLSQAYADYVRAHHRQPAAKAMRYIDRGLAPEPRTAAAILAEAAEAPSLAVHLGAVERINPVFAGLSRGLTMYRAKWSRLPRITLPTNPPEPLLRRRLGLGPAGDVPAKLRDFQRVHGLPRSGRADPATLAALNRGPAHYERLIETNIERARAIPARRGERYILVDTASAQLWTVEDGRISSHMRVIVGKRSMQTPAMAGLIRYAVLNPYWNLPPDLIRERARKGARGIGAERLEVLSDWSPGARRLDPRRVDWRAVAAGRRLVNLRQTPGAHNMMGRIKFMLPNDLGIYLHDTPLRTLFAGDRRQSSGCVRLEDAARLERWLFKGRVPTAKGTPEQRVDLPEAVPVYIAYFTVLPSEDGLVFQADPYRRDVRPESAPRRAARATRAAPAASRARRGRAAVARPARRP